MTTQSEYHPWLHRFAVLTAALALLPIVMGALTTTTDAGMAFPDWPTSDGQNMLTYPWWQSAGAKFIEHGHRLAGMLIGFVTIILVALTWKCERRTWVRRSAIAILLAVIIQGLLGGGRVRMNEAVLALIHGNFAAWVFTLMILFAVWTSRTWVESKQTRTDRNQAERKLNHISPVLIVTPIVIMVQYILGGMLRHLHRAMNLHLASAALVFVFVLCSVFVLLRSKQRWLKVSGMNLCWIVILQLALGAGAWVTRFGFASTGYVAVQQAPLQIWIRSSHTVVGMMLFATSVVAVTKYARLVHLHSVDSTLANSKSVSIATGGVHA